MTSTVDVLHVCQTGASGLVHDSSSVAPSAATWFAWGRRPYTVRLVPHGYLNQECRRAYDRAIRDELDRLGAVVAEPIE